MLDLLDVEELVAEVRQLPHTFLDRSDKPQLLGGQRSTFRVRQQVLRRKHGLQRRAKLVRNVVKHLGLEIVDLLQLHAHLVHRFCEQRHLVAGLDFNGVEDSARDVLRSTDECPDGTHDGAGNKQRHAERNQQRSDCNQPRDVGRPHHCIVDVGNRVAHFLFVGADEPVETCVECLDRIRAGVILFADLVYGKSLRARRFDVHNLARPGMSLPQVENQSDFRIVWRGIVQRIEELDEQLRLVGVERKICRIAGNEELECVAVFLKEDRLKLLCEIDGADVILKRPAGKLGDIVELPEHIHVGGDHQPDHHEESSNQFLIDGKLHPGVSSITTIATT